MSFSPSVNNSLGLSARPSSSTPPSARRTPRQRRKQARLVNPATSFDFDDSWSLSLVGCPAGPSSSLPLQFGDSPSPPLSTSTLDNMGQNQSGQASDSDRPVISHVTHDSLDASYPYENPSTFVNPRPLDIPGSSGSQSPAASPFSEQSTTPPQHQERRNLTPSPTSEYTATPQRPTDRPLPTTSPGSVYSTTPQQSPASTSSLAYLDRSPTPTLFTPRTPLINQDKDLPDTPSRSCLRHEGTPATGKSVRFDSHSRYMVIESIIQDNEKTALAGEWEAPGEEGELSLISEASIPSVIDESLDIIPESTEPVVPIQHSSPLQLPSEMDDDLNDTSEWVLDGENSFGKASLPHFGGASFSIADMVDPDYTLDATMRASMHTSRTSPPTSPAETPRALPASRGALGVGRPAPSPTSRPPLSISLVASATSSPESEQLDLIQEEDESNSISSTSSSEALVAESIVAEGIAMRRPTGRPPASLSDSIALNTAADLAASGYRPTSLPANSTATTLAPQAEKVFAAQAAYSASLEQQLQQLRKMFDRQAAELAESEQTVRGLIERVDEHRSERRAAEANRKLDSIARLDAEARLQEERETTATLRYQLEMEQDLRKKTAMDSLLMIGMPEAHRSAEKALQDERTSHMATKAQLAADAKHLEVLENQLAAAGDARAAADGAFEQERSAKLNAEAARERERKARFAVEAERNQLAADLKTATEELTRMTAAIRLERQAREDLTMKTENELSKLVQQLDDVSREAKEANLALAEVRENLRTVTEEAGRYAETARDLEQSLDMAHKDSDAASKRHATEQRRLERQLEATRTQAAEEANLREAAEREVSIMSIKMRDASKIVLPARPPLTVSSAENGTSRVDVGDFEVERLRTTIQKLYNDNEKLVIATGSAQQEVEFWKRKFAHATGTAVKSSKAADRRKSNTTSARYSGLQARGSPPRANQNRGPSPSPRLSGGPTPLLLASRARRGSNVSLPSPARTSPALPTSSVGVY